MAIQTYQNGHVKPPIVQMRNLVKDFTLGGQVIHALDGIDLDIPAGQFAAIMGPSGSGKSTLLYMIGGLDHPSAGDITVAGYTLEAMSSEALATFRRETVGFIFQAFHLIPSLTALENVALAGIFAGMDRETREQRAFDLLAALRMDDRLDHKPWQLSGGQQQRVAIARALFNDPPIIMADEPTGALDSKTGETVMKLLRMLCRAQRKTIIVVTHDMNVSRYANRVIRLRDGKIVEDSKQEKPIPPKRNVWQAAEELLIAEAEDVDYAE